MIAIQFMVGPRTNAARGFTSTQGIEIAPDLIRRLSCQTSNFAIIPSAAAAGEIQADNTKDSDLFGDPTPKPSTKPSSGRNNTKPKPPNPPLNRTYNSALRPLPHAGQHHVRPLVPPHIQRPESYAT